MKVLLSIAAIVLFFIAATTVHAESFGDLLLRYRGLTPAPFNDQSNTAKREKIQNFLDRMDAHSQEPRDTAADFWESLKRNPRYLRSPYRPTPTPDFAFAADRSSSASSANFYNFADFSATGSATASAALGSIVTNPFGKRFFIVALLGDSMIDTLGKDLTILHTQLKIAYPAYSFAIINFGQGSTDLENGRERLTRGTNYLGKYTPPILSYKPDILVVESFAYNHWSSQKSDLDRQWLTFAAILDDVKKTSPQTKVILATAIAPNSLKFGDGVLNWNQNLKWQHVQTTKAYLENTIGFAHSQNIPLADAYSPSLGTDGNGNLRYINPGDYIHPSKTGGEFFENLLSKTIISNNLLPAPNPSNP